MQLNVKEKKPDRFCGSYRNVINSSLGNDCVTPEEIMKVRSDIVYTEQQLLDFKSTFPDTSVLYSLKMNKYCLVPQAPSPRSFWNIHESKPDYFKVMDREWFKSRMYTQKDTTGIGWFAIKKFPIKDSMGKDLNGQKKLLFGSEYIPNVAEIVWSMMVFRDVRNEILFEGISVRSSSLDPVFHVIVDNIDLKGISIMEGWDFVAGSRWGLAPAWKLQV